MNKLKIQDYISVGIYTAIYFLVVTISMVILRLTIPAFNSILIPSATALFAGIIYILVINRIPRFGAITIMGSVMGIFFLVSGHFPLSFLPNIICAVLADLIQYKMKLPSKYSTTISYTVFSFGLLGPVLPLWFMKNAYVASLIARGKDAAYIDSVFSSISTWTFFFTITMIIICSILGIMIGQRLYNKHFNKNKANQYEPIKREI